MLKTASDIWSHHCIKDTPGHPKQDFLADSAQIDLCGHGRGGTIHDSCKQLTEGKQRQASLWNGMQPSHRSGFQTHAAP